MAETHAVPARPGVPTIPGYRLLEKIGDGGMGEVYRAVQLERERPVAVKVLRPLPPGQPPPPGWQRESRVTASLDHPNVVALCDWGQLGGRFYLVMEYVAGPNLRSLMRPGEPWPCGRAAPVVEAIAQALAFIHERGVLHLDLKPENVLCGPDGAVKITDFGLALAQGDARTQSELGLAQGTIDYCPPEQRYGLPVDERSDLFALATLTYELLTGRLPGRVYVPASRRQPGVPAALDEVLRRGLARDPDDRYASVDEFHREFRTALAGT